MLRNRLLIVLSLGLVAASVTWADGVGYINCSGHPDDTQVFAKARQTREIVATLACGERFTVILYGFIFSRIQTADGKVGYVYSNLITVGVPPASGQPPASRPLPTPVAPIRGTTVAGELDTPAMPAQPQPAPAQPARASAPAPARTQASANISSAPAPAVAKSTVPVAPAPVVQPDATAAAHAQPSPAPPATQAPAPVSTPSAAPAPTSPAAGTNVRGTTVTGVLPAPTILIESQPAPVQPASSEPTPSSAPAPVSPAPATPAPASHAPETTAPVAQPNPSYPEPQPESQPQPERQPQPAQPAAPPIRAADAESWERPNPGARRVPLIDLFGGYAFARLQGTGNTFSNMHGALGSVGWNVNSWLQVVGDSSYNVLTSSGTKTVLYGNHYGPRLFYHRRNRWGLTPFVEGLVGGSRADTTTGTLKTSVNTFSIKVGGGIDIRPSRHLVIRLINVDYYRTSFGGSNLHENNYWASAGIVLRLFGGSSE